MTSRSGWVCAPDSFKGTIDAVSAAQSLAAGLHPLKVTQIPMADGGEGTAAAIRASCGGQWIDRSLTSSQREDSLQIGRWLSLGNHHAVVEFAEGAGLSTVGGGDSLNPTSRSSFPVGQLLASAVDSGAQIVSLGLGGSGTIDGGAGILQALGGRFRARNRLLTEPITAEDLVDIQSVDLEPVHQRLEGVVLLLAADVGNPLLGQNGAISQYGPQKGVLPESMAQCEAGLERLSQILGDPGLHPGDGSAGGAGFGLRVGAGGTLISGATYVGSLVGLDQACAQAEWVVTGEGQYDRQTRQGKVPWHVAQCAKVSGAQVALVCGRIDGDQLKEAKQVFDLCVELRSLCPSHGVSVSTETLLHTAGEWLRRQTGSASSDVRK